MHFLSESVKCPSQVKYRLSLGSDGLGMRFLLGIGFSSFGMYLESFFFFLFQVHFFAIIFHNFIFTSHCQIYFLNSYLFMTPPKPWFRVRDRSVTSSVWLKPVHSYWKGTEGAGWLINRISLQFDGFGEKWALIGWVFEIRF